MIKIQIFIFFIALIFISSCQKDWFDIKSDKSLTVPSTLQDFDLLLNNYETISMNSPGLGEVASDGHHITESIWEALKGSSPYTVSQYNAYTWSNSPNYFEVIDWTNSYTKISYCNIILEGLEKIEPSSSNLSKYNNVKGNALFHRAKTMFDLSQIYAEPYVQGTNSPFGLPVINRTDIIKKPVRNNVHETYQSIINDLNLAKSLLPNLPDINRVRASKIACFSLLARIHLVMQNYEVSNTYTDSVLQINNKLIDYNEIPPTTSNLGTTNDEVLFSNIITTYTFLLNPYSLIDEEMYLSYEDNDLRKTIFFEQSADGIVFKGNYSNQGVPTACIATDEIYLIRAETYARLGKINLAMQNIFHLLQHRYKKNPDGSSTYSFPTANTETEALAIILSERKKELLYRGLRWSDIRRLNLDTRFQTTIKRDIGGQTYTLPPNSYRYTFPIPSDEISISNIPQNPKWD